LEEVGPSHFSHQHQHSESAEWKNKHRFYQIAEIGADNARWFWIYTFVAFVVFFVFVVLLAAYDSKTGAVTAENYGFYPDILHLTSDFEYEPQAYLPYPTCALKKGLNGVTFDTAGLSNFAFLAGIAYAYENQTQTYLNQWFGENNVINDVDIVNEFKRVQALRRGSFTTSAVAYRLFTFADKESVLSIRGTSTGMFCQYEKLQEFIFQPICFLVTTMLIWCSFALGVVWDLMSDAQLWLAATLFQALRVVLPLGNVFTPILHHTVKYVSFLESSNIEKVAFYKETAEFVRFLKARGYNVLVTGHSLGGGLALITGSQTGIPAIGMSA
jgi:lipase ATG15